MYTVGCFTKMSMYLRVFNASSVWPVASTMLKRNFHFWLVQKHLIFLSPNCLILLPAYAVRVVQSASSFFSTLPLESNIAGCSFLKTYIGMIFCTCTSVYFAFYLDGRSIDVIICVFLDTCLSLLYVVYCCHCGAIGYLLSCWVICDINGVNSGYIVKVITNCAIICNTNTAFCTPEVDGCWPG